MNMIGVLNEGSRRVGSWLEQVQTFVSRQRWSGRERGRSRDGISISSLVGSMHIRSNNVLAAPTLLKDIVMSFVFVLVILEITLQEIAALSERTV